jgi:hypothetical protein
LIDDKDFAGLPGVGIVADGGALMGALRLTRN